MREKNVSVSVFLLSSPTSISLHKIRNFFDDPTASSTMASDSEISSYGGDEEKEENENSQPKSKKMY